MEWIGFYFEHLCERVLSGHMTMPGPTYGNTTFDGLCYVPWDFKAHAVQKSSKIIINDVEALDRAIEQYGAVGLIVAQGTAIYDEDGSFRMWHQELKGDPSPYVTERIRRGASPRRRKVSFAVDSLSFVRIDRNALSSGGRFQKGFRNADGSPRRAKMSLSRKNLESLSVWTIGY